MGDAGIGLAIFDRLILKAFARLNKDMGIDCFAKYSLVDLKPSNQIIVLILVLLDIK
jgi:hypothetical protein